MSESTQSTFDPLIGANDVEGTDVYHVLGEKIGTIENLLIDKVSGKVIYAVMSFGGFLGVGRQHHPLPWFVLKYDNDKLGYVVDLDRKVLENAPSYDMDEDFIWTPEYGRTVDKYYSTPLSS